MENNATAHRIELRRSVLELNMLTTTQPIYLFIYPSTCLSICLFDGMLYRYSATWVVVLIFSSLRGCSLIHSLEACTVNCVGLCCLVCITSCNALHTCTKKPEIWENTELWKKIRSRISFYGYDKLPRTQNATRTWLFTNICCAYLRDIHRVELGLKTSRGEIPPSSIEARSLIHGVKWLRSTANGASAYSTIIT